MMIWPGVEKGGRTTPAQGSSPGRRSRSSRRGEVGDRARSRCVDRPSAENSAGTTPLAAPKLQGASLRRKRWLRSAQGGRRQQIDGWRGRVAPGGSGRRARMPGRPSRRPACTAPRRARPSAPARRRQPRGSESRSHPRRPATQTSVETPIIRSMRPSSPPKEKSPLTTAVPREPLVPREPSTHRTPRHRVPAPVRRCPPRSRTPRRATPRDLRAQ